MRATYPVCYKVDDNEWCCEMRDRKTGRTWGTGYSTNREHAVTLARQSQPKEAFIKRASGWIKRHPIRATAIVAGYMMFREPIRQFADFACKFVADGMFMLGFPRKLCVAIGDTANKLLP